MAVNTKAMTQTLAVPHEPGEAIEVRLLGWTDEKRARDAKSAAALAQVRSMGPELMDLINNRAAAPVATDADAAPAPALPYDRATLFQVSVVGWSYRDAATGVPVPVTPETLDALDPVTAEWLEEAITALYRPRTEKNA